MSPKEHIVFLLLLLASSKAEKGTAQNEEAVVDKIFQSYNKKVRPVSDRRTRTTVYISPILSMITSVDEKEGTLTYGHWLSLFWNDPKLRWNPTEFNDLRTIKIPASELWIPDVYIEKSQEMRLLRSLEETFSEIRFDGNVTVQLLQLVTVGCYYHIANFPFDKQECKMKYTTWSYNGKEVYLLPTDQEYAHETTMQNLKYNPEWNFTIYEVKITTEYYLTNGENNSYNNVIYTLKFSRLPNYFIFTMVGPSFIITMIALIGLFSPSNSDGQRQERVTIGLTTLLTMAVMLNIVCDQMPKSSLETSLLGRFVFYEMVMTSVCTCISVFVLKWHEKAVADRWICGSGNKGDKTASNGRSKSSAIPYMLAFNEAIVTIERMLEDHKNSEKNAAMWSKVFCRIDCVLLVLALIANMGLCMCVLGEGREYAFGV